LIFFFLLLSINNDISDFFSSRIFFLFLRFSNLLSIKNSFSNIVKTIRIHSFFFSSFFFLKYKSNIFFSFLSFSFFSFIFQFQFFGRSYRYFFLRRSLINLTKQLEHSLFEYSQVPYFFFARFYYSKWLPPITNAKIICEYIIIQLSLGVRINQVFSRVLHWQKYWKLKNDMRSRKFISSYNLNLGSFFYPLKGIRIICSGPPYKARRTISSKYHLWVSNEFFTGRMPLSTMHLHIDYYQSFAVLRRSNIGIKVWLLFEEVL